MRQHIAGVAAAIDGAHAARSQRNGGQSAHISGVVAAKEGADVVDAGAVPSIIVFHAYRSGIGVDGVRIGATPSSVAAAGHSAVDGDGDRTTHVGAVAAAEYGVGLATGDINKNVAARHSVAAAKEVADTEVTAEACGIGVYLAACVVCEVGFGSGQYDMLVGARSQRAAKVVAAKDGEDGAAIDAYRGVGIVDLGDEGVLGSAKEGVDRDCIVCHRDGSFGY